MSPAELELAASEVPRHLSRCGYLQTKEGFKLMKTNAEVMIID